MKMKYLGRRNKGNRKKRRKRSFSFGFSLNLYYVGFAEVTLARQ